MSLQQYAALARQRKNEKTKKARKALKYIRGLGVEPVWSGVKVTDANYESKVADAYNYSRMALEGHELKAIFLEYIKNRPEHNSIVNLPDYHFSTIGKLAWMVSNGAPMGEKQLSFIDNTLKTLVARGDVLNATLRDMTVLKPKPTKEQLTFIKIHQVFSEIDDMLLEGSYKVGSTQVQELLKKHQATPVIVTGLIDKFTGVLADLGTIDTMNQNRSNQINDILFNLKGKPVNKVRKQRVSKPKPIEEQVKKIQYLKNDAVLGDSVDSKNIVGARKVIIYDVPARFVGMYITKDQNGIQVQGSKIVNLNETKCVGRKIRDHKEMLTAKDFPEAKFDKWYASLKTKEYNIRPRLKNTIIIIKVYK